MATTGNELLWISGNNGGKLVTYGDMVKMYGNFVTPGYPYYKDDDYCLNYDELRDGLIAITSAYTHENPWVVNPFIRFNFMTSMFTVFQTNSDPTGAKVSFLDLNDNYYNYPSYSPTINNLDPIMYIPEVFITIQIMGATNYIDFVSNFIVDSAITNKDQTKLGQNATQSSTPKSYTSATTISGGKAVSYQYCSRYQTDNKWNWVASVGTFLPSKVLAIGCKEGLSYSGNYAYTDSNIFNYMPYFQYWSSSTKYGLKTNNVVVYTESNPYDSSKPQQTNHGTFSPKINVPNSKTNYDLPEWSIIIPSFYNRERIWITINCTAQGYFYLYTPPTPDPTGSSFFGLAGIRGLAAKAYREKKAEEENNKTE
jgi:hypothetical protein